MQIIWLFLKSTSSPLMRTPTSSRSHYSKDTLVFFFLIFFSPNDTDYECFSPIYIGDGQRQWYMGTCKSSYQALGPLWIETRFKPSTWSYFLTFVILMLLNIILQIIRIHSVGGTGITAGFDSGMETSVSTLAHLVRKKLYFTIISLVASDS